MKTDPTIYSELVETFCEAYDQFAVFKGAKPHTRLNPAEVRRLDPGFTRDIRAAVTIDEWGTDPFRLVILTAKSAANYGVHIHTHTRVEGIETQDQKVVGVTIWRPGVGRILVRSKLVVNLAGPWARFVDPPKFTGIEMRPSKGVHLVLDRRIVNVSLVCRAIDGRDSVFILPHEHTTLIGTTDDDFYGHPDSVSITQDDIGYLIQAVQRYFPTLTDYRIMRAFVGIRPTLHAWGMDESSLSRDHKIYDHTRDGIEGLYSMIGGKLAAYRMMAEELTDLLCKKLKRKEKCRTHLESLPGCTVELPWREEAKRTGVDPLTVRRLMFRHGMKALDILETARRNPELRRTLCDCEQVIAAEVEYCVREEWARSISDIRRRTRLGMGPCQACGCLENTSLFMGKLLHWTSDQMVSESGKYLEARWHGNFPVLYGEQAKQEEYARYLHLMGGTQINES